MIILALETTHETASAALLTEDGSLHEKLIVSDRRHEETVMPEVESLLRENNIEPSGIDCIAVDIGPGSFTGVRIGVCHANAMAFALNIPCIGISSLEAMAYESGDDISAPMIDAGNGNCYGAIINKTEIETQKLFASENQEFLETARLNDAVVCKKSPHAGTLAKIAADRAKEVLSEKLQAAPLYLRPSQAERNFKNDSNTFDAEKRYRACLRN